MNRTFTVVLVALVLAACSTAPQRGNQDATSGDDPIATYRRSQAAARAPGAFQNFGTVESGRVTLTMNGTLTDEQAPQVCDARPVQKIVTPPARQRRCLRTTIQGCAQYEGEPQPPCESDLTLGRLLYGRKGECMKRADPNAPSISYRTTQDCYRAQPAPQSLGQLTLYAVPAGAARTGVTQGRALGTFNLSGAGSSQSINVGGQTRPGECLALADTAGTPISVRQDGDAGRSHLFMTPQMAREKDQAAAQANLNAARQRAETARAEVERQVRYARDSGAFTGKTCTAPPMAALPPKPEFISAKDAAIQARASCFITLSLKHPTDNEVFNAVTAEQKLEYIKASMAVKGGGIDKLMNLDGCTQGAYSFPPDKLAYLRGETFQRELGESKSIDEGIKRGFGGIFTEFTKTTENKQQLIIRMLQDCTSATARACMAPEAAYSERVQELRAAPQKALQACQEAVQKAQTAVMDAAAADKEAKALADQIAGSSGPRDGAVSLSAAACGL